MSATFRLPAHRRRDRQPPPRSGHASLGNDELRKRIDEIGTNELAPGPRTAVAELLVALGNAFPASAATEMLVRETLEALAYGE